MPRHLVGLGRRCGINARRLCRCTFATSQLAFAAEGSYAWALPLPAPVSASPTINAAATQRVASALLTPKPVFAGCSYAVAFWQGVAWLCMATRSFALLARAISCTTRGAASIRRAEGSYALACATRCTFARVRLSPCIRGRGQLHPSLRRYPLRHN